jgi:hypothetical protein
MSPWSNERSGDTANLIGYSIDYDDGQTPTLHPSCRIWNTSPLMRHECDVTRGGSGGPLYVVEGGQPRVVAIHVSEMRFDGESTPYNVPYSEATTNFAVSSWYWRYRLADLRANAEGNGKLYRDLLKGIRQSSRMAEEAVQITESPPDHRVSPEICLEFPCAKWDIERSNGFQ